MRKHSLMRPKYTLSTLALAALVGAAACSQYDGTDRWEGVYKPEAEIDRPKGAPMPMPMDAGRPDGGAGDGAAADGAAADSATNGDTGAADTGTDADAAPDAANADAATDDAMTGDAAPADATPAG